MSAGYSSREDRVLQVEAGSFSVLQGGSNRVSALALSRLTFRSFASQGNDTSFGVIFPLSDASSFESAAPNAACGFRSEDRSLRKAVDRALARHLGSASHLALVAPFGFEAADLPAAAARSQLSGHATEVAR